MTRSDWQKVQQLAEQLLELPPPARAAAARQACIAAPDLLSRVLAILDSYSDADGLAGLTTATIPAPTRAGQMAGNYKLLHLIGEGGMGAVYLAERADQAFAKTVAVKLIPPSLATGLVDLFHRERAILARLEHAHIARLLDAGSTADGSHFFVMEYVEGAQPITTFTRALPTRQKLNLFLDACDAIHYAHLHGVIHCDLKPNNILVNAAGDVKIVDFGIARADGHHSPDFATSAFASPEQANAVPTALSDLYSLGIVLRHLLPSQTGNEIAAIVARATAPNPRDRYPSVLAFALDIRAALDGFPVQAYGAGAAYRLRKWIARHPLPSLALGTLLIFAAAGLVIALRQQEKAAAHRAVLHEMARKVLLEDLPKLQHLPNSTALRASLMQQTEAALALLADEGETDPHRQIELAAAFHQTGRLKAGSTLGSLSNATAALADLDRAVHFYRLALASLPDDIALREKTLRATLEVAYRRDEAGLFEQARQTAQSVETDILALPPALRAHPSMRRQLSTAYHALGNIANDQGYLSQEAAYRRQALAVYAPELANPPAGWLDEAVFRDHIANLHAAAASATLIHAGYSPDAEAAARRALRLLEPCATHRGCQFRIVETQLVLAEILFAAGQLRPSLDVLTQALSGIRALQALDPASAVTTSVALQAHADLIHFQLAAADLPAARKTLATVAALQSTLRKADPNDLLINESDARMLLLEATVLRAANSLPQAATLLTRALTLTLRPASPTPALQELSCLALHTLSEIAARQNQPAESLAYLRQATPIARVLRLAAPERAALLWASHVARFPQNTTEATALRAEPAPPPVSPYPVPRGGLWLTPPKTPPQNR
jgi:serine/threonine protein kinase